MIAIRGAFVKLSVIQVSSPLQRQMSGLNPPTSFPFVLLLLVCGLGNVSSNRLVWEECTDELGTRECLRYKDEDCVGVYETWARANCALRCGYCPIKRLPCVDNINYCSDFGADVCHQDVYGQYMRENCRKTCNFCRVPTEYLVSTSTWTATPEQTTTYNPAQEWCSDRRYCWRYPAEKCVGFYENWFRKNCPYRCGYCPNLLPPCEDLDPSCEAYSLEACTNLTYRAYMRENCRKRCNECKYPGQNLAPITPPYGVYTTTTASVLSTSKVMAASTKPVIIVPTQRWGLPILIPIVPDYGKPQGLERVNKTEPTVMAVPSTPIVIVPTQRWGNSKIIPTTSDNIKPQGLERVNISEASDIVSVIGNSHLLQTNEAFNVSCRITGHKQGSAVNDTSVGWLFNGQRISYLRMVSNANKYKLHVKTTNMYLEVGLEIPAVTAEDTGNYTCVLGDRANKNRIQEKSWYLDIICMDCSQTIVG
ncbi:uncharacterized protein LOC134248186 [Saccostrea cucullata]|uniref:uncharacterized protein LOC134248186 n=1 Tax=Saccostrea cuccullata TaxID=36930 RepID=UPI002ED22E51